MSELNEEQRAAAGCIEGPVMIIAGAGSGKTRTLTYRIAYLMSKGIDPFNILALTFTNKAAKEMKDRIIQLVGPDGKNLWMGTFHSIFARILRAEATKLGYISSFTIYDTDDSRSAIKQIVKQLNLDAKTYTPNAVLSRISMAKSNLISPEDYLNNAEIQSSDRTARKPEIGNIYALYNKRLRNSQAMDFDDLLFNMNILLRDFPDVLLKYQQRFQHILVDEYQDTNYSQYLIVKKLSARYQNICVVGDDAQSIYAFRGANIQNIFNFKRDYPNVSLFKLEQNYRSTQNIVNAANSIIENNKERINKEVWTDNGVGDRIKVMSAPDERSEGKMVAETIMQEHLGNDMNYKSFAILYRNNALSRSVEDALRKMNIPYKLYQGISFYGRKEIKDVLAYLRLAVNCHDEESLLRVINYPTRGIGQTSIDKVRLAAADNDVSVFTVLENIHQFGLGIGSGIEARIEQFVLMIKRFAAMVPDHSAYEVANQMVFASGIIKMLKEDDDPENNDRIDNIEELLNGIQEFCDTEDEVTPGSQTNENAPTEAMPFKTLDLFLQQVLLMTSEDKSKEDEDKVSLMTIHASKGLEFPYVFVVGMEENLFPSNMSITNRKDLEEERRLFYVAVTRAEKHLTLTHASSRYLHGNASFQEVSRFVEEINEHYIDRPRIVSPFPKVGGLPRPFAAKMPEPRTPQRLKKIERPQNTQSTPTIPNTPSEINSIQVGMNVTHSKFGNGKVLAIEGAADSRKAIVFFEGVGQKQLLLKFAKLTILQ